MRRSLLTFLICTLILAGSAAAQRRADQARLSFGIGAGYNGQTDMWKIDGQELIDNSSNVDTATVSRGVRSTIGVAFIGVYYPNDRWGISGEAHLIGLGYVDGCTLRTNSGSVRNQLVCATLQGQESPGTTVAATIGGIYRPFPWNDIQPYLRVNAGLLVSQQSGVRMRATITDGGLVDYFVYEDPHPASVSPTMAIGGGMTAFLSRAYQIRFEMKDNIVSLEHVTGTVPPGLLATPTSERKIHHVFSLTIGVEVVLEKKRGRRY